MGTIKTTNIETITGSGTLTLGQSGETVSIPSGATLDLSNATQTGVGGVNTPAFSVYMTSGQSVTSSTYTKVQFDAELFDTDGVFDNSTNYRFTVPSGQAGKYFLSAQLNFRSTSNDVILTILGLYKNGSLFQKNQMNAEFTSNAQFRGFNVNLVTIMNLSVGDYIEIYGYVVGTSPLIETAGSTEKLTTFSGYKIIE
jgi:hypothetical protein